MVLCEGGNEKGGEGLLGIMEYKIPGGDSILQNSSSSARPTAELKSGRLAE